MPRASVVRRLLNRLRPVRQRPCDDADMAWAGREWMQQRMTSADYFALVRCRSRTHALRCEPRCPAENIRLEKTAPTEGESHV